MKLLIFSIPLILILSSSCSTYYGSTMSTKDPYTIKNEYGEFMVEGDSLDVIYNFYGQNAPITVSIVNKMSKPLYVDWRKSGIMIEDVPSAYKEPDEQHTYNDESIINFGSFLDNPDGLGYIKPYSRFNKQILELTNFNFDKIDDTFFQKWHTEADSRGENKKYKAIRYTESNSPIYLRTFLTIYEDSRKAEEAFYYENDFYMSELIKIESASSPNVEAFKNWRGDFFYVKHEKEKKPKREKKSPSVISKVLNVTGEILLWAVEGSNGYKTEQQH